VNTLSEADQGCGGADHGCMGAGHPTQATLVPGQASASQRMDGTFQASRDNPPRTWGDGIGQLH
jgi:hypothetical protein